MIQINKKPGQKLIEIGCGANRHPSADCAVDCRFIQGSTDFAFNLEECPWPISSDEWDGVFSCFVLEHISWRNTLNFLKECFRIMKPGGMLILITPDTEAQMRHLLKHSDWDDAGCMLFGDLDYPENSHKAFINPTKLTQQLSEAGFHQILVQPFGEKKTDMVTHAFKPEMPAKPSNTLSEATGQPVVVNAGSISPNVLGSNVEHVGAPVTVPVVPSAVVPATPAEPLPVASKIFDRRYWDGGNEWGGFQGGYQDFACHTVTAEHVLARKPKSVCELGSARNYIVKRLQDAGVPAVGVDASRHCLLTRVADPFFLGDITESDIWNQLAKFKSRCDDLCFSIAVLDHIHEDKLPFVVERMPIFFRRGLHGINFGPPGGDKTRQTCKPKEWWVELFQKYAPDWPVEIVHKDELENGNLSPHFLAGDGKLKVQFGSHTTGFYQGWLNTDDKDLSQFYQQMHMKFKQVDMREGLPFDTESVDGIFHCHALEHITYKEGLSFLKECRRILKPTGAMRIIVPNAELIHHSSLSEFDELSGTCAAAKTNTRKLYELLHAHHQSMYDYETLGGMLEEAGLLPYQTYFRQLALADGRGSDMQRQILRECSDVLPEVSLFVEAYVPQI